MSTPKFFTDAADEKQPDPADEALSKLSRAEGFLLMAVVSLNHGLVNLATMLQDGDFRPGHLDMFAIKVNALVQQYGIMREIDATRTG